MNPVQSQNGTGLLPQQGQGFPLQQQPTTIERSLNMLSRMGGVSIIGFVVVCVLQGVMPEGAKPSNLIGAFHGGTTAATLNAERGAQVQTAQEMADAQARAAIEIETARQQQAAILQSLQGKQDMANMADYACMGGGVAAMFMSPENAQVTRQASEAACATARELRQEIINEQAEASRLGGIMQRRPVTSTSSR